MARGRILSFSIDLLCRLATPSTTVRVCDEVAEVRLAFAGAALSVALVRCLCVELLERLRQQRRQQT